MTSVDVEGTPVKFSLAGSAQVIRPLHKLQRQHSLDMSGRWIGPSSPEVFLEDLMFVSDSILKNLPKDVIFSMPPMLDGKDPLEKELYRQFVDTIAKNNLSPNMQFFISADKTNDGVAYRPDAGFKEIRCIPATSPANKRQAVCSSEGTSLGASKTTHKPQAFDWCHDALIVEFKRLADHDPFYTTEEILEAAKAFKKPEEAVVPFEKSTLQARKIRGQLIIYATEVFAHQQRTHLFQLLVFGQYVRFIYFDHSGAIVSERVNYIEKPNLLVEFMWRLNHMSNVERGWDATAVTASAGEQSQFSIAVRDFIDSMKDPGQLVLPGAERTMSGNYPVHKMLVAEGSDSRMELLVRRPIIKSPSVLGRATQGYVAVETRDSQILFLKDTWRVDHPLVKTESEIYRILERYGVPHVPRLICGGDVKGPGSGDLVQKTKCVQWIKRQKLPVGYAKLRDHVHHRLVQRVAYPIESATNSKQYTIAFYNVGEVIERSYDSESKILHRDISIGNVMLSGCSEGLDSEIVGLLADWDHASITKPGEPRERQKYRTGTWAFMSIGLLQNPKKAHEILDDFESMFWTMLYGGVHRFEHTGKIDISIFTEAHYDPNAGPLDIMVVGGDRKYMVLCKFPIKFTCKPFNRLVRYLASAIRQYYESKYRLQELEDAHAADSDLDSDDEPPALTKARKTLQEHHDTLSDPKFWVKAFRTELDKGGWYDDLSEEDQYTAQTEERQTQEIESLIRNSFQTSKQSEGPLVGGVKEEVDRINFMEDPDAIELERNFPLIPASYYRRGLDVDEFGSPQNRATSPSSSPLRRQLASSGVPDVELSSESEPSSTESVSDRNLKRKHKNAKGKTAGQSGPDPESSRPQKRPRQYFASFPSALGGHGDLLKPKRPLSRLPTARPLSGEASVGSTGLSRLSISPQRKVQSRDKGKGRMRSFE